MGRGQAVSSCQGWASKDLFWAVTLTPLPGPLQTPPLNPVSRLQPVTPKSPGEGKASSHILRVYCVPGRPGVEHSVSSHFFLSSQKRK